MRSSLRLAQRRNARIRESLARVVESHRTTNGAIDLALRVGELDRECDGSVLASAVALRVFLFFVPLVLVAVATIGFLSGHLASAELSRYAGLTGGFAAQIDTALRQSSQTRWIAMLSGLFGVFLAGRTLSRMLTTASRRAWRCSGAVTSTPPARITSALAGMAVAGGMLAIIANRLRQATGVLVAGSMGVPLAVAAYGGSWLIVSLSLPRGSADRSALLPGAAFVGASLATAQVLLQFTAPGQLSRASQLYGGIGLVIVALSWFFVCGRVFVTALEIDAVIWQRRGSVATWMMQWARLRRLMTRHAWLRRILGGTTLDAPDPGCHSDQPPGAGDGCA
jgi:uncharacterized BrkB/YihY/UPF0761 family membrane protein